MIGRDRRIEELASIEFKGSLAQATFAYGQQMFIIGHRLRMELDMSAADAEAAMSRLHGNPLLFGFDAKIKARRVAKRLKRAQDLADGIAREGERFHEAYIKHFINQAR